MSILFPKISRLSRGGRLILLLSCVSWYLLWCLHWSEIVSLWRSLYSCWLFSWSVISSWNYGCEYKPWQHTTPPLFAAHCLAYFRGVNCGRGARLAGRTGWRSADCASADPGFRLAHLLCDWGEYHLCYRYLEWRCCGLCTRSLDQSACRYVSRSRDHDGRHYRGVSGRIAGPQSALCVIWCDFASLYAPSGA